MNRALNRQLGKSVREGVRQIRSKSKTYVRQAQKKRGLREQLRFAWRQMLDDYRADK